MSIESMGWDVIITAHAEYYLGEVKRPKKTALAKIELYDPELGQSGDVYRQSFAGSSGISRSPGKLPGRRGDH